MLQTVAIVLVAACLSDGPASKKIEYVGKLDDGSLVTLQVQGEDVRLKCRNGWSVDQMRTVWHDGTLQFVGTGRAGDTPLAVAGQVGSDSASLEVHVGVGNASRIARYALRKKRDDGSQR